MDLIFLDCETTGLNPEQHRMWELAVIRRALDGSETTHLWQWRLATYEVEEAEPKALEINRYHERTAVTGRWNAADMSHTCGLPHPLAHDEIEAQVHAAVTDAVMIGSNPGFDAGFLRAYLGDAPWHYRPKDIATLAEGYLRATNPDWFTGRAEPYSSRDLSRAVGVEPPGDDGHQALVDARWARDVYDAVVGKPAVERAA